MTFLLETLRLGFANLLLHKLRSLLTALGIIIGVGAVVAIAAHGEGSKQQALASISELGARNIILRSVKPPEPSYAGQASAGRLLTYGLLRKDLARIREHVGYVRRIVPLKAVGGTVSQGRHQLTSAQAFGTLPSLLDVTSQRVERGRYLTDLDEQRRDRVAVIGAEVATRLFPLQDALGSQFRIDAELFTVVGILRPVGLAGGAGTALVGRDLNFDIHIPLATAGALFGDLNVKVQGGSREATQVELSEIYIQADAQENVRAVAEQVRLVLDKEHKEAQDATVKVPLELLEQAESTQRMYTMLMVVIASLSLLVGGIGIMNIMLASVTERTREIGIRRALGATRRHIIAQFLVETTALSFIGGVIGVGLGISACPVLMLIRSTWPALEIPVPIVTGWSIIVSFSVATTVGVIFGLYPAIRAANQDPIVALRHD